MSIGLSRVAAQRRRVGAGEESLMVVREHNMYVIELNGEESLMVVY